MSPISEYHNLGYVIKKDGTILPFGKRKTGERDLTTINHNVALYEDVIMVDQEFEGMRNKVTKHTQIDQMAPYMTLSYDTIIILDITRKEKTAVMYVPPINKITGKQKRQLLFMEPALREYYIPQINEPKVVNGFIDSTEETYRDLKSFAEAVGRSSINVQPKRNR